jgi:chromosomal replication initiation ATPase DnaA
MKEYIFLQYIENICSHMGINSSDLFVKSKEGGVVEARQLLYFLCNNKRQMGLTEIMGYLSNLDYHEDPANIKRSIDRVQERINSDDDYIHIVNKLDKIEL